MNKLGGSKGCDALIDAGGRLLIRVSRAKEYS